MLIKILNWILIFGLLVTTTTAQNNLVIYHTNGKVEIVQGGNTKIATRGDVFAKSNSLQLSEGSDCMLIGANGKSLQLNSSGSYSFDKIQQLILKAGLTNVSQRYFKYVYDNLFNVKKSDKFSVSPVVFRDENLMKTPVNFSIFLSTHLHFSWMKPADKNNVRVQIRNQAVIIFDSVFKKATKAEIDLSKLPKQSNWYQWQAVEAGVRKQTDIWNEFLLPAKKYWEEVRAEQKMILHKTMNKSLKKQMEYDLFTRWKKTSMN